jgi:hypothetical protein
MIGFRASEGNVSTEATDSEAAAWPTAAARGARRAGTMYRSQGEVNFPLGDYWATGNPHMRQQFVDTIIHELAHTQQGNILGVPEFEPGNPLVQDRHLRVEGGADALALLARNRVAEALGMPMPAGPYWGYPGPWSHGSGSGGPLGQQFINRYGHDYALQGQFQRG